MARIFLSHSSLDAREAIAVKRWLVEHAGLASADIFLDIDPDAGLATGTRWKDALRQAHGRCEAVICLVSRNWEASAECRTEYRTAEMLNKQIFVARLEASAGDDLTGEWQRCDLFGAEPVIGVDIGDGDPVELAESGLRRLREGIRAAGIGAESFGWPPPRDRQRAPYRGWEPLQEVDAAVFFGRDAQILSALDELRGMRLSGVRSLFVVLGPSGTGKSSFLRAGLLPRLRREDRRFVVTDIVRPGRDVLAGSSGLAAAIAATRARFGLSDPALGEIKSACAAGDVDTIADWVSEIRTAAAERLVDGSAGTEQPTVVLPLDQAEELFGPDGAAAARVFLPLVSGLTARLNAAGTGLLVVCTIRTDCFEQMQNHPDLGDRAVVFDELRPMPPTQFAEVITGPARRASAAGNRLRVEPQLVDRLLADAAVGGDALPMLALTLARLYTDYGAGGELTLAHYQAMGGMHRVVQTEIDEVLTTDPDRREANLRLLRAAFIPWLATIGADTDQPLRRVARYDDLPVDSRPLIDDLVAKRLLVKDVRGGQAVVEVALESLLRQWPELAGWLSEQRQDLMAADDLERTASAWADNDENPAWLLAGSRLIDAEKLSAAPGFSQRLQPVGRLLAASRVAENQRLAAEEQHRNAELVAAQERQATAEAHSATLRRRSRVLRVVVALTTVAAVIAAVGFVRANRAENDARSQFREVTGQLRLAEAQAMLAGDTAGGPLRGIQQLLAAEALTAGPDPGALLDADIDLLGITKVFRGMPDPRWVIVGEGTVVHIDDQKRARIYDVATGQFTEAPDGSPLTLGFEGYSLDTGHRSRAVLRGDDGVLRVADLRTGEQLGPDLGEAPIESGVFSTDGALFAAGAKSGQLWVWEVSSGRTLLTASIDSPLRVGGFADDNRLLLTADAGGAVRIWNVRQGTAPETLETAPGSAVTVGSDGTRAVVTDGRTARVWDLRSRQRVGPELETPDGEVSDFQVDAGGRRLAAQLKAAPGKSAEVRVWDTDTGQPVCPPLVAPKRVGFLSMVLAPQGDVMITGDPAGLQLWGLRTCAPPHHMPLGLTFPSAAQFSADGRWFTAAGPGGEVTNFSVDRLRPFVTNRSVAVGPDGKQVAVLGGGKVEFWELGQGLRTDLALARASSGLFSPDGRTLAVAAGTDVVLIDVDRAQVRQTLAGTGEGTRFSFGPDGRHLVTWTKNGPVRVWETDSGDRVGVDIESRPRTLAVAVDRAGQTVAVLTGVERMLIDVETGEASAFPHPIDRATGATATIGAMSGAISGDTFAVGYFDGAVAFGTGVFERSDRLPLRRGGSTGGSWAFTKLSAQGNRALTVTIDGAVQVWDTASATPIGRVVRTPGQFGAAYDVVFWPDGRRAGVMLGDLAGRSETVVLPTETSTGDLCGKLAANMSRQQWNDWISPEIDYVTVCPDLPIAPD